MARLAILAGAGARLDDELVALLTVCALLDTLLELLAFVAPHKAPVSVGDSNAPPLVVP